MDLIGGPLFALLYDGVKQAMDKSSQFKSHLADLKSTLDSLQSRVIRQMKEHNAELGLPNDEIEDVQRQMEEGVKMVRKLSEFRVWNRFACGDYTGQVQLVELDRAVRRLLEMLRLQEARDVKETLLLCRQNRHKLDEVSRKLNLLMQKQQKAVREAMVAEPIQGKNAIEVAALDGSGEALETVFGMLFDAVLEVEGKAVMFKAPLGELKSTLDSLKPLIKEIAQCNKVLVRPKEELEKFTKQMEKGVELIPKCSKVYPWFSCKKSAYTEKLLGLDKFLQRQLYILQMQVARDVRNTLVSIRNIEVVIEKIEERGVLQNQIQTEGWSAVAEPSSPTVGLDVVNVQGTGYAEGTMISVRKTEAVVKPIEESGVLQNQLGTKGISRIFSGNIVLDTGSAGTSLFSEEKKPTFQSKDDRSTDGHNSETSNFRLFSFEELKNATSNFKADTMLGDGGFGKVYKGWLNEKMLAPCKASTGMIVAVKKFHPEDFLGFKDWQAEVNFLGRLSHPNIVKLLGYCWEEDELLFVYEYMQKGGLENHLFRRNPNIEPLSWDSRIKIAIGVAQGLAFLHSSEKQIIHSDFKSSNIFLDENYNAKISDFGFVKLVPTGGDSHVTTRIMGRYGYAAPEYISTGHLYVKSDVYGFGVVLLEILTGLRVLDTNRPQGQHNLVDWAKPFMSDQRKLERILDVQMEGQYSFKAAFKTANITLKCLASDPKSRPSMKDVVETLEHIQAIKDY